MGLIEMASGNSVWREWITTKTKVIAWEKSGTDTYDGKVSRKWE